MSGESGFTLVEALAAGVLSVVIAGAILSIVRMTNDQIDEGGNTVRLETLRTAVSEQLRKTTRNSKGALTVSEDTGAVHSEYEHEIVSAQKSGLSNIRFFDRDYGFKGGFRIVGGYLEEALVDPATGDSSWAPFRVGEDTVFVDPALSTFTIAEGRVGARFDLRLTRPADTLIHSEFVQCRRVN